MKSIVFVLFAMGPLQTAHASGGTPPQSLEWPRAGERLTYHSCGCGDACWVAELRRAKSKKLIVRLRCDCEKLLISRTETKKDETELRPTCEGFDDSDKLKKITSEIEQRAR